MRPSPFPHLPLVNAGDMKSEGAWRWLREPEHLLLFGLPQLPRSRAVLPSCAFRQAHEPLEDSHASAGHRPVNSLAEIRNKP